MALILPKIGIYQSINRYFNKLSVLASPPTPPILTAPRTIFSFLNLLYQLLHDLHTDLLKLLIQYQVNLPLFFFESESAVIRNPHNFPEQPRAIHLRTQLLLAILAQTFVARVGAARGGFCVGGAGRAEL